METQTPHHPLVDYDYIDIRKRLQKRGIGVLDDSRIHAMDRRFEIAAGFSKVLGKLCIVSTATATVKTFCKDLDAMLRTFEYAQSGSSRDPRFQYPAEVYKVVESLVLNCLRGLIFRTDQLKPVSVAGFDLSKEHPIFVSMRWSPTHDDYIEFNFAIASEGTQAGFASLLKEVTDEVPWKRFYD